jgi:hypothetical protein
MLNIVKFFNEKGNVSVKERNNLKENTLPKIEKLLSSGSDKVIRGKDGAFYIQIATSQDTPIYARLEMTISIKQPE